MWAIRERHGSEWWTGAGWTPASNEAATFGLMYDAEVEAEEYCQARTWVVVELDADDEEETVVIRCPDCKGTKVVWQYIPSRENSTNGAYDRCSRCDATGRLEVTRE